MRKEEGIGVETVRGSLGELSVWIDDRKVVDAKDISYPTPGRVLKRVRAALAEEG